MSNSVLTMCEDIDLIPSESKTGRRKRQTEKERKRKDEEEKGREQ